MDLTVETIWLKKKNPRKIGFRYTLQNKLLQIKNLKINSLCWITPHTPLRVPVKWKKNKKKKHLILDCLYTYTYTKTLRNVLPITLRCVVDETQCKKKKRTIKRLDITLICHVYKTETIFLFFFLFIWKLEKMFNCNLFPIDGIIWYAITKKLR